MIRQRLVGLAATLGLVALLVGLPWLLLQVEFGTLPTLTSWTDLAGLLLRRDDGSLALVAIKTIGWITWALLAGLILLEVGASLRGVRAPDLRGLALPQSAARQLVAAAAALFVALPANTVPAHAAPTPAPAVVAGVTVEKTDAATSATPAAEDAAGVRRHTVKRGESLWSIAEQHLGDGRRYDEIAALNTRLLDGRGDGFLKPGWTLNLPDDEQPTSASRTAASPDTSYTVRKGDTLSEIALDHYGDARAYPRIADASRHLTQPGGRRLSDPDVIDIGWTLTIPHTGAAPRTKEVAEPPAPSTVPDEPSAVPRETEPAADHPEAPPFEAPASAPTPASAPVTPTAPAQTPGEQTATSTVQPVEPTTEPAWLLSGLAGGSILAGSLWLALRQRRAAQFRARRPGRMIATPPPDLAPVEKTITSVGAATAPDVQFIDGALRRLAARQGRATLPMPTVAAVECTETYLRLYLAEPADLPTPWEQAPDRLRWQLPTTVDLPDVGPLDEALPAPYPQLITIGTDDHGHHWLYNLEEAGVVRVTGDPDYAHDFVRHTAAELAVHPWTRDVRVECVGLAPEAVALNPRRVRHHETADVAAAVVAHSVAMIDRAREANLDIASGRATLLDDPLWESRILILEGTRATDLTGQLGRLLNEHPRSTGASLLVLADGEGPFANGDGSAEQIHLTSTGRLELAGVGLNLIAAGLTPGEANGIASIFDQADQPDLAMPDHDEDADGWRAYTNQAGQLNLEHTLPRDDRTEDALSVLPADDSTYVEVAATTPADLATLAPQIPADVRQRVEDADPRLDDDLRIWFDPRCDLPRLMTLGPLTVRVAATGTPTAAATRRLFLTEMLAYLATRSHGATTEEVAEAMGIPTSRVRKDMGSLRAWLGINPRTGSSHIPDNRHTEAARTRGRGAYEVEDLLVDADLFRRLRVRGETRGPEGIKDLKRALSLVTGTPFSHMRDKGGAWLVDTGALNHVLQCAIVDVAHVVTTACLAEGDFPGAHAAAELAAKVAPAEETAQLDLIAVIAAQGHHQLAQQMLRERVSNRSDDEDEIPTEWPARTQEVVDNQAWVTRRGAKASA
ncbi:MAG: LysM peptidoglycan-binding domain-containing protein [Nigerium sp.]|nr:LysM peptidoglycan-binding domain-containing protein [Nigerium sp.]